MIFIISVVKILTLTIDCLILFFSGYTIEDKFVITRFINIKLKQWIEEKF